MEFNPNNIAIRLCIQGIDMERKGRQEEAKKIFLQAWNEATNDFEKFTAAHYVAGHQATIAGRLMWYETALEFALKVDDNGIESALPSLYLKIANCYEELGDFDKAEKQLELTKSAREQPSAQGPFYHGTRADLKVGDLLIAGWSSNYKADLTMNHIYFTALVNTAGLAAALAKGDARERVYIVEPTGSFENDPNVTDKKFPGNPTRSYRTEQPLKVIGEVADWNKQKPEELQRWRERLANSKGEIIN